MDIQDTSIEAYDKVKYTNFCHYQKLMALKMLGWSPLCARDMATRLKVARYAFRPRITELKKDGLIMDSGGRKTFHYTDREGNLAHSTEIIWKLAPPAFKNGLLFDRI